MVLYFFLLHLFAAMKSLKLLVLILFVCLPVVEAAKPQNFTIVQMNDVYEVFPISTIVNHHVELRGGLEYAGSMIDELRQKGPVLVLHAGDFLSPSLLSIKFKHKGEQMVDAM